MHSRKPDGRSLRHGSCPSRMACSGYVASSDRTDNTRTATPDSGCGHRVTTDGPIRLMKRSDTRWAIDGTPADCVRVALAKLAPDVAWVLAGINHGGNLGADVYHSGTVAAVREAAFHGKPAIAFSQYCKRGHEIDWQRASRWAALVLK